MGLVEVLNGYDSDFVLLEVAKDIMLWLEMMENSME